MPKVKVVRLVLFEELISRHKKNVDSGSTFKTFVDFIPKVKNIQT
jgi:hypothetical protein